MFVEDMAEMAVATAHQSDGVVIDAAGPETFSFREMVLLISGKVGGRARLVQMKPGLAYFLVRLMGYAVRDVALTLDEIDGLMTGLLVSENSPHLPDAAERMAGAALRHRGRTLHIGAE